MEYKNKREHLLINKKEGQVLLLVNSRYLFIFIFLIFFDNNLIVHKTSWMIALLQIIYMTF